MDENEKQVASKPSAEGTVNHKRPSAKIIAIVCVVIVAVIAASACWFVNYQIPHNEAVEVFNAAAKGLDSRNAKLDDAISDLQDLMGSDDKPLDTSMSDAASAAIGDAQAAKKDVPEMPSDTDAINAEAKKIKGMGDYSEQLTALDTANQNLQNSIDQMKQVTNPSEQFVIERLQGLPNITGVEAATEQNDPNGNLHKDGGYTSAVFFSSDLVDQSQTYASEGYTGIPAIGTDGGGSVEVYATIEDAQKRDTYLGALDGSILSSGSHTVVGTCVVRVSDLLTASQQKAIEQSIIDSLTRL